MVTHTHDLRAPVAATGLNFSPLPSLPGSSSRVTVIHPNERGIADRMCVHAAGGCFQSVRSCAESIRDFFAHRYADFRMFWRAFKSIGGPTTSHDIDRRVNELIQFRNAVSATDPLAARIQFGNLSLETRSLLFYVDGHYMARFHESTDPTVTETMRREILRECRQAISYQRTLMGVNAFFRAFSGVAISLPRSSVRGDRAPGVLTTPPRAPRVRGGTATDTGPVAHTFDLEIPGTVPYVQNAIPAAIQQKADQIDALIAQFEAMANPPAIPDGFSCPVSMSMMALPVFDASHLAVQNGLGALRASTAAGGAEAVASLNANRNLRHTMNKDSLEAHMGTGRSWAPPKCPTCRHPENGGIRREYLRIDAQLQDHILQFLRGAVGG